jgi:hypothetical protein
VDCGFAEVVRLVGTFSRSRRANDNDVAAIPQRILSINLHACSREIAERYVAIRRSGQRSFWLSQTLSTECYYLCEDPMQGVCQTPRTAKSVFSAGCRKRANPFLHQAGKLSRCGTLSTGTGALPKTPAKAFAEKNRTARRIGPAGPVPILCQSDGRGADPIKRWRRQTSPSRRPLAHRASSGGTDSFSARFNRLRSIGLGRKSVAPRRMASRADSLMRTPGPIILQPDQCFVISLEADYLFDSCVCRCARKTVERVRN